MTYFYNDLSDSTTAADDCFITFYGGFGHSKSITVAPQKPYNEIRLDPFLDERGFNQLTSKRKPEKKITESKFQKMMWNRNLYR